MSDSKKDEVTGGYQTAMKSSIWLWGALALIIVAALAYLAFSSQPINPTETPLESPIETSEPTVEPTASPEASVEPTETPVETLE